MSTATANQQTNKVHTSCIWQAYAKECQLYTKHTFILMKVSVNNVLIPIIEKPPVGSPEACCEVCVNHKLISKARLGNNQTI